MAPDAQVGIMADLNHDAAVELRGALLAQGEPVELHLSVSRAVAEQFLYLVEAENTAGVVVVPVKEFYTTTEASSLLGVSRATLMKLIDANEIDSIKVGTHHRVPAEELLAYQRAREVSRGRTSEALVEFAARSDRFQSNVRFRAEDSAAGPSADGGPTDDE